MDAKQTGLFIAKKRKEKKLTQTELADLLQVTDKAISRWETGEGYPEISILPKLATLLGCSIDDILQGGQKEVVVTDTRRVISKFQFYSALSIALFLFGYLINIVLIYATGEKYWALLSIIVFGFSAYVLYYFQRYTFLSECNYDENDKLKLYKSNRNLIIVSLLAIFALLPHYLVELIASSLGEEIFSDSQYLRFGPYVMFALVFMVILSLPLFIIISIYEKKHFGKPFIVVLSKSKMMIYLSTMMFLFLFYTMIIDQYYFQRALEYRLNFMIPIVFIAPCVYPLFYGEKRMIIPLILNIIMIPGLYFATQEHVFLYESYSWIENNGYHVFKTLKLVGPGALLSLGLSIYFLIKEMKKNKKRSFEFYGYRNLIFISLFLIIFFIGLAFRDFYHSIEVVSIVFVFTWYISDLYLKAVHNDI